MAPKGKTTAAKGKPTAKGSKGKAASAAAAPAEAPAAAPPEPPATPAAAPAAAPAVGKPLPDADDTYGPTTVRFIRQRIHPYIGDRLQVMEKKGVSLGGMSAFDPNAFTENLGKDNVYECVVSLASFSMYDFNYDKNPPTVGSIMRVRDQLVPALTSGKLTYDKGWQPQSLPVRAASIHPPTLGTLVPLVSEELRVAVALAWADAVRTGETAAAAVYEDIACSIKVRFELETDDDEAMLKKWTSSIKVKQIGDSVQLVGVRRCMEVSAVATLLKNRGKKATSKTVAEWFRKAQDQLVKGGNMVSEDSHLDGKKIELHMRVMGRLEGIKETLLCMESQLGGKHPLTTLKSLDMICGITSVESKKVSAALTNWVIDLIFVQTLRGDIPLKVTTPVLKIMCLEGLLVRRILLYIQKKNKLPPSGNVADRGSQTVLMKLFGNPLAYHKEYPRGKPIIDYLREDESTHEVSPSSTTCHMWLSDLPQIVQDACGFCHALLDRRADVQEKVSEAVSKQPYVTAESFLAELDTDIFDMGKFAREAAPLPPAPPPPPAPPTPPSTTDAAGKPQSPEPEPADNDEDHQPSGNPPAPSSPGLPNSGKYFPDLVFDDAIRDQLDGMGNFVVVYRAVEERMNQLLEMVMLDPDPAKWRQQVIDSQLFKQVSASSKVLFSVDLKNQCMYVPGGKDTADLRDAYKAKPGVDSVNLKRYLEVIFGPEDASPTDRKVLSVAHKSKAKWVTHVYDCRREGRHGKTMTLVKTLLKDVATVRPSTFRLLYSNNEFSSKTGLHTIFSKKNMVMRGKKTGGKARVAFIPQLARPA